MRAWQFSALLGACLSVVVTAGAGAAEQRLTDHQLDRVTTAGGLAMSAAAGLLPDEGSLPDRVATLLIDGAASPADLAGLVDPGAGPGPGAPAPAGASVAGRVVSQAPPAPRPDPAPAPRSDPAPVAASAGRPTIPLPVLEAPVAAAPRPTGRMAGGASFERRTWSLFTPGQGGMAAASNRAAFTGPGMVTVPGVSSSAFTLN